jgi:hypothetical protein
VGGQRRLRHERGLAQPGLAPHQHDLPLPRGEHVVVGPAELLQLRRPADEGARVAGQPRREGRGRPLHPLPHEVDGAHGLREALQLEGAEVDARLPQPLARHHADGVGGHDLVVVGQGAQPGGHHHRLAEAVPRLEGDVAHGQAHADRQGRLPTLAVEPVDRLLGGAGGPHAVPGGHEGGHHAVAQALHPRAAVGLDGGPQQPVVRPPDLVVARAQPDRQLG